MCMLQKLDHFMHYNHSSLSSTIIILLRAVVYHLKGAQPKIIEYRVGPIKIDNSSWPLTNEHIVQEGDAIDYRMRPVSSGEYERMETLIAENMRVLSHLSSVFLSFNLPSPPCVATR
jgi:hypothetical protein